MKIALLTTDNREPYRQYDNPTPWFGTAPEALLQGFAQLDNIEIHVISCSQKPMISSPEKLAENIWFHSLHVPKIGWGRTLFQGCVRAVRKKLRELQPDVVHGQGTERDCALSAVFSGFSNVLTIHGNMKAIAEFYRAPFGSYHWLAGKLETVALKKTIGVFCNSAYTENLVAPRAKKIWRVPNALRSSFFDSRIEHQKNAWPVLLNIGVLEPRKQQVEILETARKLWRRGVRFEIQFAGNRNAKTDYGADFSRRLVEAEAAGYARHLGALQIGRLIAVLDAADALIHFPTEEAFGLVVAEALSRNLKFFGAKSGGVVDIASDIDGAELFDANDFQALENSIAKWIEEGCPRPIRAAETMCERYHPAVIAKRHLEIYREVLATRS